MKERRFNYLFNLYFVIFRIDSKNYDFGKIGEDWLLFFGEIIERARFNCLFRT